jgi:cell wall-associated NlpC family hydrolase
MEFKTIKSVLTIITCATLALTFTVPPIGAPMDVYAAKASKPGESTSRVSSAAAKAKLPKGRYVIRPAASDTRAVTVKGSSKKNGANIYLYDGSMATNQQFDVSYDSKGRALIKNVKSGKYVSVAGNKAKKGANVIQATKSASSGQRWVLEPAGTNHGQPTFQVRSALSGSYYMQLAGGKNRNAANIRIWTKNKSRAEKFVFVNVKTVAEPAEGPVIADGIYRIGSGLSSALALTVPGSSAKDGVAPALAAKNSALSQLFIFTYENGYYHIRTLVGGKSLTIQAGNVLAGAGATQYDDASKPYQRFKLVRKSGGAYYQIIAKSGGLALRVATGVASSGQTLETYYPSTSMSQKFTLTPVTDVKLSSGVYSISPHARAELNLSIEGSSKSENAKVSASKDSRSFVQKFYINRESGGGYSIQNINSQLLLTASGSDVVQRNKPDAGPSIDQLWDSQLSVGGMKFISRATGQAMQLVGGEGSYSVQLAAPSESTEQAFITERTGLFDAGQYRIDSRSGAGSLEVEDASFFRYASIVMGEADGSGAQAWFVSENSDGTFTIRNERSGKPMETTGSTAGANVRQNKSSGSDTQKWTLVESGNGWYTLNSASGAGDHCLDAGASDSYSGESAEVRTTSGVVAGDIPDNMEWRFTPVKITDPGPPMPSDVADAAEKEARKHLGKRYVFGAEGPNTFDCSGFIYYVMNHSDVREMRRVTAQDIYDSCVKIPASEAKRGDLIFFKNTYKTDRLVTHLGIYLGGGKMIHAGSPVQISRVDTKFYKAHFYAYARMA